MLSKIEFFSEGCRLVGNLFIPKKSTNGKKAPGIVLCNSLIGDKEFLVHNFAERFCKNGFVVLTFDYRGFGESEGESGKIVPINQVTDIRNAITYLTTIDEVDSNRIILWGTSYGGGNAILASSIDKRVKKLIVQGAFGNGERVITDELSHDEKAKLFDDLDRLNKKIVTKNKGLMVPIEKILTDEESKKFFENHKETIPSLNVKVPFITLKETIEFKPEKYLKDVKIPILIVAAENDKVNPIEESYSLFRKAKMPRELYVVKNAGHYDLYEGKFFEEVIDIQLKWLDK